MLNRAAHPETFIRIRRSQIERLRRRPFASDHRLHADPARLSLRALRDRRHGHEPVCGLDRGALRADLDALCRAGAPGHGAALRLAQLDPAWAIGLSVAYVMVVQGASAWPRILPRCPRNPL